MVRDNDSIPKVRSRYGAVVLRKNRSRWDSNSRPYDATGNGTIALTTAPQLGAEIAFIVFLIEINRIHTDYT